MNYFKLYFEMELKGMARIGDLVAPKSEQPIQKGEWKGHTS